MDIALTLAILIGGTPQAGSFEDDARNEAVWRVAATILHQSPDKRRTYEWVDDNTVYVGIRDAGTSCWLGADWHAGIWGPLYYECMEP